MKDSGSAILKKLEQPNKENQHLVIEETMHCYKIFLTSFCKKLLQYLHPSAAFPGRTTAAGILHIMASTFTTQVNDLEFLFAAEVDCHVTQTFLESLTDTFEQNKQEIYEILTILPKEKLYLEDKSRLKQLFSVCFELATSTRPQDCTTAAYLLKLLVQVPCFYDTLKEKQQELNTDFTDNSAHVKGWHSKQMLNQDITNTVMGRSLLLLQILLDELCSEISVANSSLLHASATRPMYPVLHCVRYLLADLNLKHVDNTFSWKQYLNMLLTACFDVAKVVAPVVTNSSPEGNVCVDPNVLGSILQSNPNQQALLKAMDESANKVNLMPEYLVVCCWRSIKEVSLLLGQLTESTPIIHELYDATVLKSSNEDGLLSVEQVKSIGLYFKTQLLESIHRGAFELAYAGFIKMTAVLWMSPIPSLFELPKFWLEEILVDISSPNSTLCSTRRSAGVPFYVQAIISSEPSTLDNKHLKWIMEKLMHLALGNSELIKHDSDSVDEDTAQVHSLNILRTLFRDAHIGDEVFPFAGEGLKVAILGYSSKFWAVRNSASLLFSALIVRIFGVKRSKEDASSRKNCMTGRVFFQKFPLLYDFLLDQIAVDKMDTEKSGEFHLHPGLFPVLLVLSRLFPSATESNTCMNLDAFVPHVIRCNSSAVFKTRVMASHAILPLVSREQICDIIVELLASASKLGALHNYQHGALLQACSLLDSLKDHSLDLEVTESRISPLLLQCCVHLKDSRCFPVLSVLTEISFKYLHIFNTAGSNKESLLHFVKTQLIKKSESGVTFITNPWEVEFQKNIARSYLEYLVSVYENNGSVNAGQTGTDEDSNEKSIEELIISLLNSKCYEVQLVGLQFIVDVSKDGGSGQCSPLLDMFVSDKGIDKQKLDSISFQILGSTSIFGILNEMLVDRDLYHECLVLVLENLFIHKSMRQETWDMNLKGSSISVEDMWKRIMKLAYHSIDLVRCAALKLAGIVLQSIIKIRPNEQNEVMSEITSLLEERCAAQHSVESRLSAALVLSTNTNILLDETFGYHRIVLLWSVLLRLLQDEDTDVRSTVAGIVPELTRMNSLLKEDEVENIIESSLAVELAVKLFAKKFVSSHTVQTVAQLISWMEEDLEPVWDTQNKEVRLFDKGEMNTYRDELHCVKIVQSCTKSLLASLMAGTPEYEKAVTVENEDLHNIDETRKLQVNDILLKEMCQFLSHKYTSVYDEIIARLDWVNSVTLADPFLKLQEYKMDVMFLVRKLCTLNVIVGGLLKGVERKLISFPQDIKSILYDLHRKIESKFNSKSFTDNTLKHEMLYFENIDI